MKITPVKGSPKVTLECPTKSGETREYTGFHVADALVDGIAEPIRLIANYPDLSEPKARRGDGFVLTEARSGMIFYHGEYDQFRDLLEGCRVWFEDRPDEAIARTLRKAWGE